MSQSNESKPTVGNNIYNQVHVSLLEIKEKALHEEIKGQYITFDSEKDYQDDLSDENQSEEYTCAITEQFIPEKTERLSQTANNPFNFSQSPALPVSENANAGYLYRLEDNQVKSKTQGPRRMYRSNSEKGLARFQENSVYPRFKEQPQNLARMLLEPQNVNSIIQYAFNIAIGIVIFGIMYLSITGIQDDLYRQRQEKIADLLHEKQLCANKYIENRCNPAERVPLLESDCKELEKCMNSDPEKFVKSSKLTATLIAEILNQFVEPLGLKTMIFFFIFLFGVILVCNCSLASRKKGVCCHDKHKKDQ